MVDVILRFGLVPMAAACLAAASGGQAAGDAQAAGGTPDRQALIDAVKKVEAESGIRPTGNFDHADPGVPAYYRCYYTGPLELPATYDGLRLREGTQNGCRIDGAKYDVFFYPIEAVASGTAPVTEALEAASEDRVAMVVPHEDFHAEVRNLPGAFAEAAATLVGFLTAQAFRNPGSGPLGSDGDAELFLRKAGIVNRYYDQVKEIYGRVREGSISKAEGLERKRALFAALGSECGAIAPAPRTFNKRISAANNAGLAFDHTYTLYYPLLYRVFVAEGRDLRATVGALANAPKMRREAEAARYFSKIAGEGREDAAQGPR